MTATEITDNFTINELQKLACIVNKYNSLPNQCGGFIYRNDDGVEVFDVKQPDGTYKQVEYNHKDMGLWWYIEHNWDDSNFLINSHGIIRFKDGK